MSGNVKQSKTKTNNRRSLEDVIFVDSDGYVKKQVPGGGVAVLDVDEYGNPIMSTYIGGTSNQARQKYWDQAPIMAHAVDSIANIYGLNPEVLRNRLNKEGFTDDAIKRHNKNVKSNDRSQSNYEKLHELNTMDFSDGKTQDLYGMDDGFYYIESGKATPTEETVYDDHYFINSEGRKTHAVHGETTKDNISLQASILKYLMNKSIKDFPGKSQKFYDNAAGIYYWRGPNGGRKYIKKNLNSVR